MPSKPSLSKSPRWSAPARWLCVLLPLGLGTGCGPQEEGEAVDAPRSLRTGHAPVEMPPEDDACHEWTRQYTTTTITPVDIRNIGFVSKSGGTMCQEWNECVTTTTWTESFVCLGPTIANAVLERYGVEGEPVCDTGWTHSNC